MNEQILGIDIKTQRPKKLKKLLLCLSIFGLTIMSCNTNKLDNKEQVYVVDAYWNNIDTLSSPMSQFHYGYPEDKNKLLWYKLRFIDWRSIVTLGDNTIWEYEGKVGLSQK